MRAGIVMGALTLLLAMPVAPAVAGDVHRWVDDDGTVHYSHTPRPEASDRERQVYDRHGFLREVVPPPPTVEEREARAEEERRAEAGDNDSAERDARRRQLERAYDSLGEIERQRKQRLEALENNVRLSERQAERLERERDRIEDQKSRNRDDPGLQRRYASQLEDVRGRLERERSYMERQQTRIDDMNVQFDADAEDYRELVMNEED
nr:DUF4124 domain-containing protein [Thioalkalivibrio sp. ALJ24]